MSTRAAIITGASSGIGFALARLLAEEGHAITMAARRPEKLAAAAQVLRDEGHDVLDVAGDLGTEEAVAHVVGAHHDSFGRLDVLVNNAGMGRSQAAEDLTVKAIDLQLATNLRSVFLFYRQAVPLLRSTGAEHHNALVVNISSLSGKMGEKLLGVYSATKHGIVGFTQAMNSELGDAGIKSCALCPGFVDTPMTDFLKEQMPAEEMIQVSDIAESVRFLLRTSNGCVVPEIVFTQPTGSLLPSDADARAATAVG
ncbi:MAG: SDR family oxidoreductase [Solirubrobacteraceae bacterium]|nr:SDR family oxidoreductase [Solirubrobacteraceae bacterium]